MKAKKPYQPHNPRWFNRILHWSYGLWLTKNYHVHCTGTGIFNKIKPPYVLIPNHVSAFDPFIVGSIVPDPVYWITSDGNMRSSLMRILLSLVGSIPKSKSIPDMETVGTIVRVVRKKKGVIGIFAEGQACWDGRTQAIFPSTAKLLMLLKAPVIVPLIKGLYFSSPRWAKRRKKGQVEIEFKPILMPQDYTVMSAEAIQEKLNEALAYNEYSWSAANPELQWIGSGRALGIERALFLCPCCGSSSALRGSSNRFSCSACGAAALYDRKGGFKPIPDRPFFNVGSIVEWDRVQWTKLREQLLGQDEHTRLLHDSGAILFRGKRFSPLRKIRGGNLGLYKDRLVFTPLIGEAFSFPLSEIEGIGTLKSRTLEFYRGKTFYRIRFTNSSISARKWQGAVEILNEAAGIGSCKDPGRAFYLD